MQSISSASRTELASSRLSRRGLALCALAALVTPWAVLSAATVKVTGEITTAMEVNPDYRARPSPVSLIVFQLASADSFQNADFFSLYDPDSGVLGGDLIQRTQIILQPGEVRPFENEFDEEARFIGIIAAYRDIENAEWRAMVELPQKGFFKNFFTRNKMYIDVGALAVSASIK